MYGYHNVGFYPKQFILELERNITKTLAKIEEVELEIV